MKKLWPAALALVALIVLYFVFHTTDNPGPPRAAAAQTEPMGPGAPPTHVPPSMPASPSAAAGDGEGSDQATGSGPTVGTPALAESPPDMTPKKGKMTLDDKLAETAKHIGVMKHRSELLQADIDKLDKAGKTKEAAEQRVVLERLQKHMKELQTAIDEHKEPM